MKLTNVEKKENNQVELSITVEKDEFEKAMQESYKKNVKNINVQGFRKGHAPRKMIEKIYGEGVFYEDAMEYSYPAAYEAAIREANVEPIANPSITDLDIKDGEFTFKAVVQIKPELGLKEYKGLEVEKPAAEVTEDELNAEIDKVAQRNARQVPVEREAQNGDVVIFDFEGFTDGKPFEGGKAEEYSLELGSGMFIPGFEDQIVGHSAGDAFDVEVTFPEDYHAKELAGKAAVFKTVLHEIQTREVPELTDAYADDKGFDSVDAFREDVKQKLTDAKAKSAAAANENAVIGKVVENAQIELPEPMIETQVEQMIDDYARRMQSQGLQLDQYMEYTGMTMDKLKEQFHPQAVRNLKTRLTLEKVVEAENIEVSEDAIDAEIKRMAEQYKVDFEKMKEFMTEDDKKNISMDLKIQEAVDFLVAEAKLV